LIIKKTIKNENFCKKTETAWTTDNTYRSNDDTIEESYERNEIDNMEEANEIILKITTVEHT